MYFFNVWIGENRNPSLEFLSRTGFEKLCNQIDYRNNQSYNFNHEKKNFPKIKIVVLDFYIDLLFLYSYLLISILKKSPYLA